MATAVKAPLVRGHMGRMSVVRAMLGMSLLLGLTAPFIRLFGAPLVLTAMAPPAFVNQRVFLV
jgi:hypothetical protein